MSSNFLEFDKFGLYDKEIRSILLLLGRIYTIYLIGKSSNLLSYILTAILPLHSFVRNSNNLKKFLQYDFIAVTILKILESLVEPKAKFQRMLHQIKEHIYKKKFPRYLQNRLLTYYKYRYQDNFFQENIIYHTLSSELN